MQQKNSSENSGSAPISSKLKIGRRVAPVADDNYKNLSNDNNDDDRTTATTGNKHQTHQTAAQQPDTSAQHSRAGVAHLTNLMHMKVPNIKVLNRSRPREEEITKCQTKCFFFLLGVGLMAFGIGLTFYGDDADLRDFLILGPSFLIIGFLLVVIGSVLICKDVYIVNSAGRDIVKQDDDEGFNYYNIKPLSAQELTQANTQRMDLYAVTSSRPQTVTSSRSDGALTTSELLLEPGAQATRPDPVVPSNQANQDSPIRSVPHLTGTPTKTVQNNDSNNGSGGAHGGSTITVRSSEDGDCGGTNAVQNMDKSTGHGTPVRTGHGTSEDSTYTVKSETDSKSKFTVQMKIGGNTKESQESTAKTAQTVVSLNNEPMTTDL